MARMGREDSRELVMIAGRRGLGSPVRTACTCAGGVGSFELGLCDGGSVRPNNGDWKASGQLSGDAREMEKWRWRYGERRGKRNKGDEE